MNKRFRSSSWSACAPWRALAVALALAGAAGCGSKLYPVTGRVSWPDGKPLTEGMVVFESQDPQNPGTARGEIRADGSYRLGTNQPGDGVHPGTYRALVTPKYNANAVDGPAKPAPFDPRFMDFKTSGLQFTVTSNGPNEFAIQVSKRGS
jgi:hypothetical protein